MKLLWKVLGWSALLLGVIALRVFIIEIFWIPSGSMKHTLLPGDIVFSSKLPFGTRFGDDEDLYRSWSLGVFERGDIAIFNFPEADTVYERKPDFNYHDFRRKYGSDSALSRQPEWGRLVYKKIIHRIPYIKRIVAFPGDTLQISNDSIFINNEKQSYIAPLISDAKSSDFYKERNVAKARSQEKGQSRPNKRLAGYKWAFPHVAEFNWSRRWFGPLIIPRKGWTIDLDLEAYQLYGFIIESHEHQQLNMDEGGVFYLNGVAATSYTFQQDYYFGIGDNRSSSIDSRQWGLIPASHMKAKALLVLGTTKGSDLEYWFSRFIRPL